MAKLGNEVWDVQWLQARIRALESELAEMRKRPPKELWDELCEQVAQMCEYLGSNRTDVPCDSWHLRDLIVKLRKREEWTECRDGYMPRVGELVLFWAKGWLPGATPGLGRFDGERWEDETQTEGYDDSPVFLSTRQVSHWMPAPRSPYVPEYRPEPERRGAEKP